MKKIFSLLCVTAMAFSLIACGGNTKETTGETVVETEIAETTQSADEAKDIVMHEPHKVVEAAQGQQIQVDAKYGTYRIAITAAEEVDWWYRKHETDVKHVVVIHYEIENISFDSNFSEGVELTSSSFTVLGSNNYKGKHFNTYYDGYEAAGLVKPGEVKSGTFAYEIDNPSRMPEYYTVTFKNSSGDIAKVKVDIK